MPVFGAAQVMFVRGSGTELWDSNGKRYLDFLGGLAVIALGHANPAITEVHRRPGRDADARQQPVRQPTRWPTAAIKIDALLAEATGAVGQVFFCNSGAEANETALKLARKFGGRGRHGVVSAFGSFHGRTLAALAATGQPAKHEPFFPMPDGFRHVVYNDIDALEAAIDPTRRRGAARAGAGRGRRAPGRRSVPARRPRAVRRARPAADARRDPDRASAAPASGSASSTPASSPTS